MTSPDDKPRARQRLVHIVLGDLLEADLPSISWELEEQPRRFEDDHDLCGWIRGSWNRDGEYGDSEMARDMAAWARFLHGEIEIGPSSGKWCFDVQVQGVRIRVYASLSAEYVATHEPPRLADLLNRDLAGQFVRRSAPIVGELTEVVG